MAEHMFAKCMQVKARLTCKIAENLADLVYEIGKHSLAKRNYEIALRWLERAYDILGDKDLDVLSSDVGELRLCTMHRIGIVSVKKSCSLLTKETVQANLKLQSPEAKERAWDMVKLMETVNTIKFVCVSS